MCHMAALVLLHLHFSRSLLGQCLSLCVLPCALATVHKRNPGKQPLPLPKDPNYTNRLKTSRIGV